MIPFHEIYLKAFLSLGCIKAKELKKPKRVTHSLSQYFLGRTGDTVQITNWNWTQSARHLYLTELSFLKSLLQRLTYFESKHKYLPNIRKNFKFQLWRYRTFSKGPFPLLHLKKKWICQMTVYKLCTWVHRILYKCLFIFTNEICPNWHASLAGQTVIKKLKSIAPDSGYFPHLNG